MTWPTDDTNINTTNLESAADSPAPARADLKTALDEIKNIINGRNQASGVPGLDASSKILNTQLPNTLVSSTGTLALSPNNGMVTINNYLKLATVTRAAAYAQSPLEDGMIAMLSNGDSTVAKPAYYAGAVWRYFDTNSEVSSA
jgi:hypothetical protein